VVHSWDPEFVLLSADFFSGKAEKTTDKSAETITAELASWLSASKYFDSPWPLGSGRVIVRYKFRGVADTTYATLTDVNDKTKACDVFPPSSPKRDIVPPNEQVILAEAFGAADDDENDDNQQSLDVTETIVSFAGPDGMFDGIKCGGSIIAVGSDKHSSTTLDCLTTTTTTTIHPAAPLVSSYVFFDDKIVHVVPKGTKRVEITFADGSAKNVIFN